MKRVQVQLTDDQIGELKWLADQRGVSMAELLRRGADEVIRHGGATHRERMERALAAAGSFKGGGADVAERHDDYLAEIYTSSLSSSTPQRSTR
ncbi:MAG: ribbon-helix-helix domain-containing protein [Solirubrobacteraceae bacterium MAG38_C4-C5]|nr:ribbon-helix-helix domain-containing protein [Candidatus Siliceabacter maunaloa]